MQHYTVVILIFQDPSILLRSPGRESILSDKSESSDGFLPFHNVKKVGCGEGHVSMCVQTVHQVSKRSDPRLLRLST